MTSFQCPGVHSASLCPCCVLWLHCASRAAWVSWPQRRAAAGRAPSVCSLHTWWLRPSHEPEAAGSDHSWITDTVPVHSSMLGWLHTWQHLCFMFCVWFTIKIGENPTNLNSKTEICRELQGRTAAWGGWRHRSVEMKPLGFSMRWRHVTLSMVHYIPWGSKEQKSSAAQPEEIQADKQSISWSR